MLLALHIICISLLLFEPFSYSSQRDRFVFTQLKYDGDWDPYPFVYRDVLSFVVVATSIRVLPERRVVTIDDKLLFSSSFIIMLNNGSFRGFTDKQRKILRRYLNNGGTMFIEDSSAQIQSKFDSLVRKELSKLYPDSKLYRLKQDNVLYKTFYLIRHVTGRKLVNNYLEGMDIAGRTAVLYSQNDIFGVWARDNFGNYFLRCIPGGEDQRFESQKLTINIIVYSLTGTYKNDKIHQPFIKKKLGIY
jgi:hypothetical protein